MPLAQQTTNPGSNGSNARYSLAGLRRGERGWTDGTYWYDDNGLSLDRPDSYVPGLAAANELDGRDPTQGPITGGGGGPGGGGGGGGRNANPWYNQLESLFRAQGASEQAAMRSALQQMLIGYGLVPENFEDKFGALDDVTRKLIQKNTDTGISTMARLREQRMLGNRDLINRLNARGLRRSGAKGYGLRKNQLGFDRDFADSLSQLMGQVGSKYSQYASNDSARQMALMQAAMQYFSGSTGSSWSPPPSSQGGGYVYDTGNPVADSVYNTGGGVGADWFAPLANSNLGSGGSGGRFWAE